MESIAEYTAALGQPRWHRANLYQRFIQTLESATACPPVAVPRFVCGISALPPVYSAYLQALGKHIKTYSFLTTGVGCITGDIKDPARWQKPYGSPKTVIYRCSVVPGIRKPYLTVIAEQDICNLAIGHLYGKNCGRDYIYLLSVTGKQPELDAFVGILRQIIFCIGFRRISLNWKAMRWRA